MPKTFQRACREPLVHFLGIGGLIFGLHFLLAAEEPETDVIHITKAQVEQLSAAYSKTWQQEPSKAALKALVDDYVKEEIAVREAQKLGLGEADPIIRRRLHQKMGWLAEREAEALVPSEAELSTFLQEHASSFAVPPRFALMQIYLRPESRAVAQKTLAQLRGNAALGLADVGDASMLPQEIALSTLPEIAAIFGPSFADQLTGLRSGEWTGPIASEYGLHLVRITQREDGARPGLEQIRPAVLGKWREAKRAKIEQKRLEAWLKTYQVQVEE